MNASNSLFRPDLSTLPAYVAGKPAPANSIKVASNELPFPTLPGVQAAIASSIGGLNRYPDMSTRRLTEAIAAYHHVETSMVSVGNGSVALIQEILHAVCTPGAEVVFPWRSFEAYPIAVQLAGGIARPVPLRSDGSCDTRAMIDAITPRTRAILLCTPNNPTGSALQHDDVVSFLNQVPENIAVLLDEAYVDFVTAPGAVDGITLANEYPNLFSLRTFSKAWGLAGLRVGYAVANAQTSAQLRTALTPFEVNTLAQVAGCAALEERAEVERRVKVVVEERDKLLAALRAQGWKVPASQANFVWFPLGPRSEAFTEVCARHGIVVRCFAGEGVRVTVAEPEASLRLLRALEEFRVE